jgi:D-alanyl-D-alanine carboxypeptidase (penicillin-binding protein 5/6)
MKIFDLEFYLLSSVRKVRARVRQAFQKKQLSGYLFLRYLSVFVIAFNIFISNTPPASKPMNSRANAGVVLSQETKAETTSMPVPQRIPGTAGFDGFLGRSALVLDATTSAVLYEKDPTVKLPPASLTKMMTSLVVLDYRKLTDEVRVSEGCTKSDGAKVGFVAGQDFTVESLLYALLLPSASDAACALSETLPLPGPEASPSARFVAAMNKKAQQLGLKDTIYKNSVGLDEVEHYSTAADLLILSKKFMETEDVGKIVAYDHKKITTVDGRVSFDLKNTNELLSAASGFYGIKTGYTPKALGCLSFLYKRDARQIIGVILGSSDRFADAKNLVRWVFESYEWR